VYLHFMAEVKIKTGERETTINRTVVRDVITSIFESGHLKGAGKYVSGAKSGKNGKNSSSNTSRKKK
jgi:hypothetical protein